MVSFDRDFNTDYYDVLGGDNLGYSSLKNKVIWQVTSFSRDVFVERAELSATQSIPLMFAFMGYRLRCRGFSLYGMGFSKKSSHKTSILTVLRNIKMMLCGIKKGSKKGQKKGSKNPIFG
jgi:hypothetical protein